MWNAKIYNYYYWVSGTLKGAFFVVLGVESIAWDGKEKSPVVSSDVSVTE
jgi:hypothetical protein